MGIMILVTVCLLLYLQNAMKLWLMFRYDKVASHPVQFVFRTAGLVLPLLGCVMGLYNVTRAYNSYVIPWHYIHFGRRGTLDK